jgi:predicted Zn-dependent protease
LRSDKNIPSPCRSSSRLCWRGKFDDFAKAAEVVLNERRDIGHAVARIARFFHNDLQHRDRANQILTDARRRGVLSSRGEATLADYLVEAGRPTTAIDVLKPLVEKHPDDMHYRARLLVASCRAGCAAQLVPIARAAEAYCREHHFWDQNEITTLAKACLDAKLYALAAEYYGQAISLRLRDESRGIGDEKLTRYYLAQAKAYAHCKQTDKAVEAAASAVVCWPSGENQRSATLLTLHNVLRRAPDFNDYVAKYEKRTRADGTDSPLLRKAIADVYYRRYDNRKALEHYQNARQLQPGDDAILKSIQKCHDRLGETAKAIDALLARTRLNRERLDLYETIANRCRTLGRDIDAERALTSIVEAMPNEAKSHTRLAQIRQKQDRWADAADHWREVVRIRSLEPTGLLKLAEAQIHLKRRKQAAKTLEKLRTTKWPKRFRNVPAKIKRLEERLGASDR